MRRLLALALACLFLASGVRAQTPRIPYFNQWDPGNALGQINALINEINGGFAQVGGGGGAGTITLGVTPTSGFTPNYFLTTDGSLVQQSAGPTSSLTPGAAATNLGMVDVTGPAVGMKQSTSGSVIDNAPLVETLMQATGAPGASSASFNGNGAWFPGAPPGQAFYYFSTSLDLSRQGNYECQGPTGLIGGVTLVFAAGVDGVIIDTGIMAGPDNTSAFGSSVNGCNIQSLGFGESQATLTNGGTSVPSVVLSSIGPAQPAMWGAGDGVIITADHNSLQSGLLGVSPGAYISGATGTAFNATLTLASPFTLNVPNASYGGGWFVYQLPAALGFSVSTEGPGTGTATASWATGLQTAHTTSNLAWTTASTTVSVNSCSGISAGQGLIDGSYITPGSVFIGVVSNCTGGIVTLTGPAQATPSSAYGGVIDDIYAITPIQVTSATCTGVLPNANVHNVTANNTVGFATACIGTNLFLNGNASNASSTSGDSLSFTNNIFQITSSPASPNSSHMQPGDIIWTDAYPFGAMIGGVQVFAPGLYNASVYDFANTHPGPNATVTHTSGSGRMWKLPSGVVKRATAVTRKDHMLGFPIGFKENCGTGNYPTNGGINCTNSLDQEDYAADGLVGYWTAGNNTGGSTLIGMEGFGNTITDAVMADGIASIWLGGTFNSVETGRALQTIMGSCNSPDTLLGSYVTSSNTGLGGNFCIPYGGGLVVPAADNTGSGPMMFGTSAGAPNEAHGILPGGLITGLFSYQNNNQILHLTYGGAPVSSGNTLASWTGGLPTWVQNGTPIHDRTAGSSGYSGTIQSINPMTGTLTVTPAISVTINTGDVFNFGGATTAPCLNLQGGFASYVLNWSTNCGGGGAQMQMTYYASGFQSWGIEEGGGGNWDMIFGNGSYTGYRADNGQYLVFPSGFMVANAFDWATNTSALVGGGEHLWDEGQRSPGDTANNTTATASWTTTSTTIPVTSCTGASSGITAIDVTHGNGLLGNVTSCSGTTLTLQLPPWFASSGSSDSITFATRRTGDYRLNQNPTAGGYSGWVKTNYPNLTWSPFGLIALDGIGQNATGGGNEWQINAPVSGGTKPTLTGTCATGTQVGGMTAGSFKPTGTCAAATTVIVTLAAQAAPNGWTCNFHDLTTPADNLNETAYTTTVVTATTASGLASADLITFDCTGF